jgi:DNA polymerase-3 subunit gamma/tau
VFEELIGQEHVAQALSNAIATNRVGHAYLFTGARGVGKTSAARILAKALNCQRGPSAVPCNECDICRSVSGGDDVDVLEIDGASNRGIDEIRQLRQNVNVRPSRTRFKIYIIDEVHMLTREAFNALLKTLEEPPEHVKFIFCTTEPTKIPVTILSRCQRFDFAGIVTSSIQKRLRQIVEAEGVEADAEALEVLARRAAGSMRDSQSLLEQLLSFSTGKITLADVHGMLGTAGDQRLCELLRHLVERNAAAVVDDLDRAMGEGVDVAQLLEQLLGSLRDCMVAAAGCRGDAFLYTSPSRQAEVTEVGKRWGLETIFAVMQILDQALGRMRFSTQTRTLAELALVRICHLENLDELAAVIGRLQSSASSGSAPPASQPGPARGNPSVGTSAGNRGSSGTVAATPAGPPRATPPPTGDAAVPPDLPTTITPENAAELWTRAIARMSGMAVEAAGKFDHVVFSAPNRLVIEFKSRYALAKSTCERPEQLARFQQALAEVTGQAIQIEFQVQPETVVQEESPRAARNVSPQQRLLEATKNPMVQRAGELFGAHPIRLDESPERE